MTNVMTSRPFASARLVFVAFLASIAASCIHAEEKPVSSTRQPSSAKEVAAIEPTWESLAANYRPPQWFQDGKIGVWMHWGIPSAADENRPNDGSHYGRRMYGTEAFISPGKKGIAERDAETR